MYSNKSYFGSETGNAKTTSIKIGENPRDTSNNQSELKPFPVFQDKRIKSCTYVIYGGLLTNIKNANNSNCYFLTIKTASFVYSCVVVKKLSVCLKLSFL